MHVRGFVLGGAALAALAFTACSGAGSGASVAPGTPFARPQVERTSLYVANRKTSRISVYAPLGNSPVRTITEGVVSPTSMLFDAQDDLYVGNGRFGDTGGVVVYGPLSTRILRHLQPREPIAALAMDASGNLYAGRVRGGVEVYAPGAESPSRTITAGVRIVGALAVDSKGNLYVLNSLQQFSQTGTEINVFAPGGSTSIRQYKFPVTEEPLSMAFDAADNLYVGIKSTKQFTTGQVDFYEAGNPDLRGRYVELAVPAAVALDKTGYLYVADSRRNDVYVYVPHQRTLARRLTDDLDGPASLAFDKSGNVYVGNTIGNSVTVYGAGKKTLEQTITNGVADPVAIGFGP
jgi:serine/threonine protein kinase, bacterial